eukprot:5449755-Amphidinium_carterae.1
MVQSQIIAELGSKPSQTGSQQSQRFIVRFITKQTCPLTNKPSHMRPNRRTTYSTYTGHTCLRSHHVQCRFHIWSTLHEDAARAL